MGYLQKAEEFLGFFRESKALYLVIAANIIGTLFGFYYYQDQFAASSEILWPFIPDSPLATLLIALALAYRGRKSIINSLAFIGNIKYGLWTVFVLLFYFGTFSSINSTPMYLFLLLSHLLMAAQAFILLEFEIELRDVLIAGAWFLMNDTVDYLFDTHTYVYSAHSHPLSVIGIAAVSLTVLSSAILVKKLEWRDVVARTHSSA